LLAICYSLQLTNCFTGEDFEIYIGTNKEKSETMYVLRINNLGIIVAQNGNTLSKTLNPLEGITVEKHYVI
jgi:hypothetical protein